MTHNTQTNNLTHGPWNMDEAADRLARGPLPPCNNNSDWRRLLFEVIIPRAQHLEKTLQCDNLLNLALEHLPNRLRSFDSGKGRFVSWLEIVLRNLARDEQRLRRRFTYLLPGADVQPDSGPQEEVQQTNREERLQRLERALDELARTPQGTRQRTDFHAVLLISLRLALVSRLKRSRKALSYWNETRTGRAEQQLPWSPQDLQRTIQRGWPFLRTVWRTVADGLEASGRNPTDDRIVALLKGLPGIAGLTAETWRQWRKRMVAWAVRQLGPDDWRTEVEPWLETRVPRRVPLVG